MSYYIFNDKDEFFDVYINDVIFTAVILGISYNRYSCNVQRLFQHLQQNNVAFSKNLTFKLTNNVSYILIMYGLNFNVSKLN